MISMLEKSVCSIKSLTALCSHPNLNISDEINVYVRNLQNLGDNVNLNIRSKLQFIIKQLN